MEPVFSFHLKTWKRFDECVRFYVCDLNVLCLVKHVSGTQLVAIYIIQISLKFVQVRIET
jgi:hypothetical protein